MPHPVETVVWPRKALAYRRITFAIAGSARRPAKPSIGSRMARPGTCHSTVAGSGPSPSASPNPTTPSNPIVPASTLLPSPKTVTTEAMPVSGK